MGVCVWGGGGGIDVLFCFWFFCVFQDRSTIFDWIGLVLWNCVICIRGLICIRVCGIDHLQSQGETEAANPLEYWYIIDIILNIGIYVKMMFFGAGLVATPMGVCVLWVPVRCTRMWSRWSDVRMMLLLVQRCGKRHGEMCVEGGSGVRLSSLV